MRRALGILGPGIVVSAQFPLVTMSNASLRHTPFVRTTGHRESIQDRSGGRVFCYQSFRSGSEQIVPWSSCMPLLYSVHLGNITDIRVELGFKTSRHPIEIHGLWHRVLADKFLEPPSPNYPSISPRCLQVAPGKPERNMCGAPRQLPNAL